MSGPAPSDLSVAFRSFGRRLREATGPASDDPERTVAAAALVDRFRGVVEEAAADVGAPFAPGSDVADTAVAVAERIEATHADEWAPGALERLSDQALECGRLLRDISRVLG
jgi:hypothetical protein